MNNPIEIGKIVRRLRGELSLREFSKKCDISHTTLDNIEKGKDFRTGKPTNTSVIVLSKIADAAGVPLSYIIGDENRTFDNLSDTDKKLLEKFSQLPEGEKEFILDLIATRIKKSGL